MIYLMSILNKVSNINDFQAVFSDLDFELNELGYSNNPTELIDDLLIKHFDIEMTDQKQLNQLTKTILNKNSFNAAINVAKLKR